MLKVSTIVYMVTFSWSLSAQNLVVNGEYDTDTNGWSAFSTISWVSDDGATISGNGSLLNTSSNNNNASFPAVSNKFPVLPDFWYLTGVSYKVPTASSVPRAWYQIHWYDDMNNEIGQSNQVDTGFGVPNDVWENLAGMSQAPAGTATGELRIYFQKGAPGDPDVPFGLWDDVYVFEETVFLNGFD